MELRSTCQPLLTKAVTEPATDREPNAHWPTFWRGGEYPLRTLRNPARWSLFNRQSCRTARLMTVRVKVRGLSVLRTIATIKQMTPERFLRSVTAVALLAAAQLSAAGPPMTVYKTRTCGCCAKWVEHVKANGFDVSVKEVPNTAQYRRQFGVPEEFGSCHTATISGYAIEGHVPAVDIQQLLKSRPKAKGLAVPDMPIGSPGMEQGSRRQSYSVVLFQADGRASEFQKYPGNSN